MNIQPIPYGVNRNAIAVLLEWDNKEFFSDVVTLKVNLMDEGNNLIESVTKEMLTADYMAFGATKEERAIAILSDMGYEYVAPEPMMP